MSNKYGLFKVELDYEFDGRINFQMKDRYFLSYKKAWEYVLKSFTENGRPMPWFERFSFPFEEKDCGMEYEFNRVRIRTILPFYLQVGKGWF